MSLGLPYSLPTASTICTEEHEAVSVEAPLAQGPGSPMATTHMHVDLLPIALGPADRRRDDDQGVLADEIPYAPFLLVVGRGQVELEGLGTRDKQQ